MVRRGDFLLLFPSPAGSDIDPLDAQQPLGPVSDIIRILRLLTMCSMNRGYTQSDLVSAFDN